MTTDLKKFDRHGKPGERYADAEWYREKPTDYIRLPFTVQVEWHWGHNERFPADSAEIDPFAGLDGKPGAYNGLPKYRGA